MGFFSMRLQGSLATALVISAASVAEAQQPPPTNEELWQVVQRQQAQIEALQRQLESTTERVTETDQRLQATAEQVEATGEFVDSLERPAEQRTTIGGYGELHYNNLDVDDGSGDIDAIDYHRFVLFFGHRFNERVRFFSELELEHSLAGEGQPGEVELEQAYVDFALRGNTTARAGLFLIPIGILNETHEPPTFYGVERNDVESIVIPSTWWEGGGGFSGGFGNGLSWDIAMHSGLEMPTTGSSAFRVRSGRQKVADAIANDWAYTGRIRYRGIQGLELAASYQYQADPSQRPSDGLDSGRLFSAHAIYQTGDFALRALYAGWSFDGAAIEAAGDDDQTGWFVEPSYRLSDRWGVYARYEDVEAARDVDQFTEWEAGFNFWPVENVVLKFDYRTRDHDLAALAGDDFDGFDLGLGYQF